MKILSLIFLLLFILSFLLIIPLYVEFYFDFKVLKFKIDKIIPLSFNIQSLLNKEPKKEKEDKPKPDISSYLKNIKVKNISILYVTDGASLSSPLFLNFFNLVLPIIKELSGNNFGSFYYRIRFSDKEQIKIYGSIKIVPITLIIVFIKERINQWKKKKSIKISKEN